MIRVAKSKFAPQTLATTKAYDGEDVKRQLLTDQHEKCYLCERHLDTDFQIEHFLPGKHHPELIRQWTNLYLACSYCNNKKEDGFNSLLVPTAVNIEEEIKQTIDFKTNKALFSAVQDDDESHRQTIELLARLFNGKNKKFRTTKEDRFFKSALRSINRFHALVNDYFATIDQPTHAAAIQAIRNELAIDCEYLGFKYWIIQQHEALRQEFAVDVRWNKD